MRRGIVEWAPFRLADGVGEEQLLAASRGLQEDFLARQRGFRGRDLLRGPEGAWVDLVHWEDRDAAEAAMKAAMESPVCHRYFRLMAGAEEIQAGNDVHHYERVTSYS